MRQVIGKVIIYCGLWGATALEQVHPKIEQTDGPFVFLTLALRSQLTYEAGVVLFEDSEVKL